ncbi:MAG: response regulator [Candidatus Acidiferrales bacterium]
MPKILVADDNANIQKMVSLALEERGISVVSVGNGEAAVRRIPDLDPDLVLADIFMPVRNGYEVCEFVKKDERFAHVPVILLVGAFDPLDEKEARRVGADGVLKKPFVPPDPLIAMVTSALEKNPRVAAELAKAKEAKAAPPPEPIPTVDLSARPEPKPLPEFPEPSPEEAALVYGFGKGVRPQPADEDVDVEEFGKGPVAIPNSRASEDDEDEDEQSTSKGWRRTAMDLEIPADVANKPAIPSMDDLAPISFPSEKDYPPRRVTVPEPMEEMKPAANNDTSSTSSGFSLRQVEDSEPEVAPEAVASAAEVLEKLKLKTVPEPESPVGDCPMHEANARSEALPESNSTSAGGHWLDAVASADAGHVAGGWMDALNGEQLRAQEASEAGTEPSKDSIHAIDESARVTSSALPVTSPVTVSSAEPHLQSDDRAEEYQVDPKDGQSFFADESEHEPISAPAPEHRDSMEQAAGSSAVSGRDIEIDEDSSAPSLAFKDPALVEPPPVHVTPEPTLVDEDASGPSLYGAPAEETTPLHSFIAPPSEAAAAAPVTAPTQATEFSVQAPSDNAESLSDGETEERVPTMPPPNREALAHIPFLTPPPSFIADMNSSAPHQEPRAADPETVDAVVQKVLERLQPQLEELLSQGLLKPLVESLLQNEMTKKP